MQQEDADSPSTVSTGLQVGYYVESTRSSLTLVRSIGVLCTVFGVIRLILFPVRLQILFKQRAAGQIPTAGLAGMGWSLSIVVSVALAIVMLVAGIGFLRRVPEGRRLLLGWAWATVAWAVFATVLIASYLSGLSRGRIPLISMVEIAGGYAEQWLVALVMPVLVLVLLRRSIIGDVFEKGGHS